MLDGEHGDLLGVGQHSGEALEAAPTAPLPRHPVHQVSILVAHCGAEGDEPAAGRDVGVERGDRLAEVRLKIRVLALLLDAGLGDREIVVPDEPGGEATKVAAMDRGPHLPHQEAKGIRLHAQGAAGRLLQHTLQHSHLGHARIRVALAAPLVANEDRGPAGVLEGPARGLHRLVGFHRPHLHQVVRPHHVHRVQQRISGGRAIPTPR
mmetsp:Transcript_35749/g.101894  ORF Transcript_35749/g.101894 Transcript_35749/m.101894 type:complete len:208 (-) Transcript_35749:124-747(-)